VEIEGELMNRPFQCGAITIGWSGDEGPYHLLLTPIEIRQHSYNVSPGRAERDERGESSELSEATGEIERSGIGGRPGNRTELTNRYGYLPSIMVQISIR